MEERTLPSPLPNIRSLPYGTYRGVRVVYLHVRDGAHGTGDLSAIEDNVPHAVLRIQGRQYVIDDAQEFRIGHIRGPAPEILKYYTIEITEPRAGHHGSTADRIHRASVRYIEEGATPARPDEDGQRED